MSVKASLIILTKNAGVEFEETLKVIFENYRQIQLEVIVIDSGSKDKTLEIVKKFPAQIHTIRPDSFGHGKTRNLAMRLIKGEIGVFLTQDAQPTNKDWLVYLLSHFSDENVAGVFGRQLPKKDALPMEEFFLTVNFPETSLVKKTVSDYSFIPGKPLALQSIFFSNVNSAIKKAVWEKFPFREDLVMSEDQQWSKDVIMAGYKIIYEPKACVYHSHNYSLLKLLKRNFDSGASLNDIIRERTIKTLSRGIVYIFKECIFLIKKGNILYLLYFFIYEFVRFSGFFMGRRFKSLPVFLKMRLSQHLNRMK